MENRTIKIEVQTTSDIKELNQDEQTLIRQAQDAAQRAYAPYSKFNVGACLLLDNGEMVEGNNQENASYPCGCCAERTALFFANSKYPNVAVKAIAIAAYNENGQLDEPITPCGICRQALLESEIRNNKPIKVIMNGKNRTNAVGCVSDLLPLSFDKNQL